MNNGELPAQPTPEYSYLHGAVELQHQHFGLTKREWFASLMPEGEQGISVLYAKILMGSDPPKDGTESIEWWAMAEAKYKVIRADALLKALETK